MYDNLRLTELHEDVAFVSEHVRRYEVAGNADAARGFCAIRDEVNNEIRARVARQEIGPPYLGLFTPEAGAQYRLLSLVPDAARVYPRRGNTVKTYGGPCGAAPVWIHHAHHELPVEGCHLCQEGR